MSAPPQKIVINGQLTIAIIITTLLPMIDYYGHSPTTIKAYDRVIFYFIIPMILILILYRHHPKQYGLMIGNWREGMIWVLTVTAVLTVFLYYFAQTPDMKAYYLAAVQRYGGIERALQLSALDLFAWEFVWRGFLLFTFAKHLGVGPAIFLQAVPFAFMHLGKPEWETYSTIFGGAGFGFIAWRTQSVLYTWLIHWAISAVTLLTAVL